MVETEVEEPEREVSLGLRVLSPDGQVIVHTAEAMGDSPVQRTPGKWVSTCTLPPYALNVGTYALSIGLRSLTSATSSRRTASSVDRSRDVARHESLSRRLLGWLSGAWHRSLVNAQVGVSRFRPEVTWVRLLPATFRSEGHATNEAQPDSLAVFARVWRSSSSPGQEPRARPDLHGDWTDLRLQFQRLVRSPQREFEATTRRFVDCFSREQVHSALSFAVSDAGPGATLPGCGTPILRKRGGRMSVLRIAVPLGLLALFLWRARMSPIYLLGIPFLQIMGQSVFLEHLRVFELGGRFGQQVPMMAWLLGCWLVCLALPSKSAERHQAPLLRSGFPLLPEEILLLLVGAVASGHVLYQFALSGDARSAVGGALGFMSMIFGYFLVRDIVRRATRSDVVGFLGLVVIANTVAAGLYVLHQGLHLHIYEGAEYFTTVVGGQVITRSFWFAPQFSILALSYVLARKEWKGPWLAVLVITALSVWVSYTRTLLLVVLVAVVVALLARELHRPDLARFLRRAIGIGAVGIIMLSVVMAALPTESRFFGQRIGELSAAASGGDVANWTARMDHFMSTGKTVARRTSSSAPASHPHLRRQAEQAYRWSADMAWIAVVYRFGLAGMALFG